MVVLNMYIYAPSDYSDSLNTGSLSNPQEYFNPNSGNREPSCSQHVEYRRWTVQRNVTCPSTGRNQVSPKEKSVSSTISLNRH